MRGQCAVRSFRPRGTRNRREEKRREEKRRSHRNEEKHTGTRHTESPDHGVVHVASQIRTDRFPVGSLSPPMPPWQPDPTIKPIEGSLSLSPSLSHRLLSSSSIQREEEQRERELSFLFAKIRSRSVFLSLSLSLSQRRGY